MAQQIGCRRCCLIRCKGKEGCSAKGKHCNICQETGHFSKSSLCPKRKLITKKLERKAELETEDIGRNLEEVQVGKVHVNRAQGIRVTLAAPAPGKEFWVGRIRPLTDTVIKRTMLNLKDWMKVGTGA